MIEIKTNLNELSLEELFQELGLADYTYIELSNYLEHLERYRSQVHEKIKEKQNDRSLDSGK